LKSVALINPYTYGVDLLKHSVVGALPSGMGADFAISTDIAVLVAFTAIALVLASWRFSRESAYEPMISILSGKRDA
jgi:ABC-2 type transport system permease protein